MGVRSYRCWREGIWALCPSLLLLPTSGKLSYCRFEFQRGSFCFPGWLVGWTQNLFLQTAWNAVVPRAHTACEWSEHACRASVPSPPTRLFFSLLTVVEPCRVFRWSSELLFQSLSPFVFDRVLYYIHTRPYPLTPSSNAPLTAL